MKRNETLRNITDKRLWVAASLVGALGMAACSPTTPDGTTCAEDMIDDVGNLSAGILGTTVDVNNVPVPAVRIYIPGTSVDVFSDANGRFEIAAETIGGAREVQLYTEKDGYPDKVIKVAVPGDMVADALIVLKAYTKWDEVDGAVGGEITDGQTTVTFKPGSFMDAETKQAVTGPVQVALVTYRPYDAADMRAAPGELIGTQIERDADGNPVLDGSGNPKLYTNQLFSSGMLDVLMMQDGRKLELIPGSPAGVLMSNIVEGTWDQDAVDRIKDEHPDEFTEDLLPKTALWHFNYDSGQWDRVEGTDWGIAAGTQSGYLSANAEVPEFSPANKDSIVSQYETTDSPIPTCVCKNVKHANGTENVRGSDITLTSRAYSYRYLVTVWNDGSTDKVLIAKVLETAFSRAQTDQQGNFCGTAIVDPYSKQGSVLIDSTKTYWPGRTQTNLASCQTNDTTNNCQYQDVDGDNDLDDDNDDKIDLENIVGFLGDTHYDKWTLALNGTRSCGAPESPSLPVECINEPTDPVTGTQPQ